MPSWSSGIRKNLLILYPWGGHLMSDWAMLTGAAGTGKDRWAQGGATNASWTAAESHIMGAYAARFNPSAATCYLVGQDYAPTTWLPRDTALTPYLVARVKCKSGSAGSFKLKVSYYDNTPTLLGSDSVTLTPGTGDLAADNTWRITRSAATIPSGTTQVKLTVGFDTGTPTADAYVDWFTLAYMYSGDEYGPASYGVSANHPFSYDYEAPQFRTRNPAGQWVHRRARARLRGGSLATTAMTNGAAVTAWTNMFVYGQTAPLTIFYRQTEGRDAIEKTFITNRLGLEPVSGRETFIGNLDWREVA